MAEKKKPPALGTRTARKNVHVKQLNNPEKSPPIPDLQADTWISLGEAASGVLVRLAEQLREFPAHHAGMLPPGDTGSITPT